jgi:hypothetical protein
MLTYYLISLQYRHQIRKIAAHKYENRLEKKMTYEKSRPKESYQLNPIDEIFSGDTLEKASEIETQFLERKVKELETPASKNNRVRLKKKKSKAKELETPASKNNRVKLKKKKSKQLKDSNKQDKKLKPKKTHKHGKKFKKWKATSTKNKGFINQKAAPVKPVKM